MDQREMHMSHVTSEWTGGPDTISHGPALAESFHPMPRICSRPQRLGLGNLMHKATNGLSRGPRGLAQCHGWTGGQVK